MIAASWKGTLRLAETAINFSSYAMYPAKPAKVFLSYSHSDKRLAKDLRDHLAMLRRERVIVDWYDREITSGENWAQVISDELDSADIFLLLISASFLASNYCMGVELRRALERSRAKEASVLPIILRACDWEDAFGGLQALPTQGKPVMNWRDKNEAFRDVVKGIKGALLKRRSGSSGGGSNLLTPPVGMPLFLNHTSFLRKDKQDEFRRRTGVPVDHFDLRVIVDSYDQAQLDRITRVEYTLDEAYPEPIRVRTKRDRAEKFLLKELANGESLLLAKVFLEPGNEPILLQRYLTLWRNGPELT